jgi:heme A synthase
MGLDFTSRMASAGGRSARRVRFALWISVAAGAAAFESGITLTSARMWAQLDAAQLPLSQAAWLTRGHLYAGVASAVAALVALVLSLRDSRRDIWALLAAVLALSSLEGILAPSLAAGTSGMGAALHGVIGQVVFAGLLAAAVLASVDFEACERVSLTGGFPLRGVGLWLPIVLMSQVVMGALYRHDVWSVMPHMGGAMAAAFLIVGEAVVLLQRAPDHRLLGLMAKTSLWLVLVQVLLGISDFLLRLLDFQDSPVWFALSIGHASVGCLTFAAGTCLGIAVRRVLTPEAAPKQTASPAG